MAHLIVWTSEHRAKSREQCAVGGVIVEVEATVLSKLGLTPSTIEKVVGEFLHLGGGGDKEDGSEGGGGGGGGDVA